MGFSHHGNRKMKVRCSHCGHTQTLRQASNRRTSEDGKELFQCSHCHRYSTIYSNKTTTTPRQKTLESNPIDDFIIKSVVKGLRAFGFNISEWKTDKEIEQEKQAKLKQIEEERKRQREEEMRRLNSIPIWL